MTPITPVPRPFKSFKRQSVANFLRHVTSTLSSYHSATRTAHDNIISIWNRTHLVHFLVPWRQAIIIAKPTISIVMCNGMTYCIVYSYQKQASRSKTVSPGNIIESLTTCKSGGELEQDRRPPIATKEESCCQKDRVGRDKRQTARSVPCRQASISTS
jgi:hypothetical protein